MCLPHSLLHYALMDDDSRAWEEHQCQSWGYLPAANSHIVSTYVLDGLVHVKGWTLKLVVLHFPLGAPGACTTMVVSLPEARFQESLS